MLQDLVITILSIVLTVNLLPQLIDAIRGTKINRITSGTTAACLVVMGITYTSLGLTLSSVSAYITAILWGLMFFLSFRNAG